MFCPNCGTKVDKPETTELEKSSETEVSNDIVSEDAAEEDDDSRGGGAAIGLIIAGIAIIAQFLYIFAEPEIHRHYGNGKAKMIGWIVDLISYIPEWVTDVMLAIGMVLIFSGVRSWMKEQSLSGGKRAMMGVLLWTSVVLGMVSVLEAFDYEWSAWWLIIDFIIGIECFIAGCVLSKANTGGMSVMMIVYGIVSTVISLWSLSYDEYDEGPSMWTIGILYFINYGVLALMLLLAVSYASGDDDEASSGEPEEVTTDDTSEN